MISPLAPASAAPLGEPQWAVLDGQGKHRVLYVHDCDYNGPGQRGVEGGALQDTWAYEIGTTDNDIATTPKAALMASHEQVFMNKPDRLNS